jgi:polar amino acid transport system substrate-binding protein
MVFLLTGVILVACSGKSGLTNPSTLPPTKTPIGTETTLLPTEIPGSTEATFQPTKICIGMDATYPPFEMLDTNKRELVGFDVDLMKAIAAKAGLEVEFINIGFNQLLSGIAQCQYDGGISAIAITDELKQKMIFSNPYFTNGQVVVVKTGNVTVTGRDTLAGMTVGTQKGSISASEIEKIPGAQMKTYATFDLAFQDLIQGLIDAVITDKSLALSYVGIKANNLKVVGDEFAAESYGIAICRENPELVKKINDGLAVIEADGTLDSLTKKWLESPVIK